MDRYRCKATSRQKLSTLDRYSMLANHFGSSVLNAADCSGGHLVGTLERSMRINESKQV